MSANVICLGQRESSAGAHCWHQTDRAYMSNPPQWDEVCCHCGEVRRVMRPEPLPRAGHGPRTGGVAMSDTPVIRLTLPVPPKPLWPNARPHWSAKATAVRNARQVAWAYARNEVWRLDPVNHRPPMWPEAETRVVFYFATAHERDRDNAAASLKAYWDGIADAGVVDNDAGLIHFPPEMRIDRERPRVEIEVTALAEADAA